MKRHSEAIDRQPPLTAKELAAPVWRTSHVCRLLSVSRTIVKGCLDDGSLRSYRLPISGQRRITRRAVVAFLRRHNLPQLARLEKESTHDTTTATSDGPAAGAGG